MVAAVMTALSDPRRLIGNLLQLGAVESVDLGAATCRVRVGELVTGDLPWLTPRAGATRVWSAPAAGEQVLLLCPEGDVEGGLVLPALFSDAHPAPASDKRDLVTWSNGAELAYDADGAGLVLKLPDGRPLKITAPAGVTIEAPVAITGAVKVKGKTALDGDVTLTGKLTASDDVLAAGKSLKRHTHFGVQPGGGSSGPPQ
jgi:phage baseplate assembly protein V